MGFENTAYGGTYNTPQTPHPPPPSYEQSIMNHNQQHNGLQRDSNMNASFCSTSSSATTAQSVSDSFIEDHQLLDKYQPNNQAYDTGAINLMNPNNNNNYQPPPQQPYYPNPQQQPIPPHFQNQVVYPTLNPQPTQQQPPINQYYYPQQQPIKPSLPPIPQKTQPMSMNYQKPMPPQHQPMMMQPPQQPMIHHRPPMQPVMMTPQPTLIAQRTVTTTYTPPQTVLQPVFVTSGPVVTRQYPTGNTTTIVTTTTPTNIVQPVRVVHGPPPSMPPGAVGYSAYYPQHSVPVPSTTVYVQQKKKKSLFNKFVHGE